MILIVHSALGVCTTRSKYQNSYGYFYEGRHKPKVCFESGLNVRRQYNEFMLLLISVGCYIYLYDGIKLQTLGRVRMSFAQIQQNYQIGEVIGHGSSCTVRKVIRRDTRQVFAIKCYQNQILKAKNQIDMLIRLDHPSIVNIYEVFQEEDTICLVLQYMAGGQLYPTISQKSKFTESQVRQYMKAIVDAVRYCHQIGVCHRDIKPENLLLTTNGPDGILKLADFGISKIMSDDTLCTNCGTPVYMAPEIWKGQVYSQKVDIWSLGVVMYYLLTGKHPFVGEDDQRLGQQVREKDVLFQEDVWGSISPKAITILRQMLQKDPALRPTSHEVSNSLWLNHAQSISSTSGSQQHEEINLVNTVVKVGRYIYKEKLKKTNNKLKALLNPKMSKKRMQYCVMEDQMSFDTQSMMTQGETV